MGQGLESLLHALLMPQLLGGAHDPLPQSPLLCALVPPLLLPYAVLPLLVPQATSSPQESRSPDLAWGIRQVTTTPVMKRSSCGIHPHISATCFKSPNFEQNPGTAPDGVSACGVSVQHSFLWSSGLSSLISLHTLL